MNFVQQSGKLLNLVYHHGVIALTCLFDVFGMLRQSEKRIRLEQVKDIRRPNRLSNQRCLAALPRTKEENRFPRQKWRKIQHSTDKHPIISPFVVNYTTNQFAKSTESPAESAILVQICRNSRWKTPREPQHYNPTIGVPQSSPRISSSFRYCLRRAFRTCLNPSQVGTAFS